MDDKKLDTNVNDEQLDNRTFKYDTANDRTTFMTDMDKCMKQLEEQGFTNQFKAEKKLSLVNVTTNKKYSPKDVKAVNFYRFEGISNPDDMSVLYAVETNEGVKGTLVDAYGLYSDDLVGDFMKEVEIEKGEAIAISGLRLSNTFMHMPLSLLDNDFYKFTMQQCVIHLFPEARVRYQFINRGKHVFPLGFADRLEQSVKQMESISLTADEKSWLAKTCSYFSPVYLDFLQGYRYDASEILISQDEGQLNITIEGYWYRTILWEVPLLALVSELFYEATGRRRDPDEVIIRHTREKMISYQELQVTVVEFGTRRRFSYEVQNLVVQVLKQFEPFFVGTSNMHLAMIYGLLPIGTHAHEWFMFHAAKYGFVMANKMALDHWVEVYRGDLGIALCDTFTTEEFFEIFDKMLSRLFDGIRQDSGNPVEFAKKAIHHYQSMSINPLTKTIIFSDALDPEKVKDIAGFCKGKIGMSFGIGTNFTNDAGQPPMNIVIKMTHARPYANWIPVIKISDEKGKQSGDPETVSMACQALGIA